MCLVMAVQIPFWSILAADELESGIEELNSTGSWTPASIHIFVDTR